MYLEPLRVHDLSSRNRHLNVLKRRNEVDGFTTVRDLLALAVLLCYQTLRRSLRFATLIDPFLCQVLLLFGDSSRALTCALVTFLLLHFVPVFL
jgi:hypothetical protein